MSSIGATVTIQPPQRTVRLASGDITTATTALVAVAWPAPFDDLNYTVTVVLEHANSPSDLTWAVRSRTTDGVTIAIRNSSLATRSCTVHATATPD